MWMKTNSEVPQGCGEKNVKCTKKVTFTLDVFVVFLFVAVVVFNFVFVIYSVDYTLRSAP